MGKVLLLTTCAGAVADGQPGAAALRVCSRRGGTLPLATAMTAQAVAMHEEALPRDSSRPGRSARQTSRSRGLV